MATALTLVAVGSEARGQTPPPTVLFAVKASPQSAGGVSAVLSEIAEPREIALLAGETADQALRRVCGKAAPSPAPAASPIVRDGQSFIRITPCLLTQPEVRTLVGRKTSLEAIAVQLGLGPGMRDSLRIVPSAKSGRKGVIAPEDLMPGDTVVARDVPLWTPFTPRAGIGLDRASMVARFAAAFRCGTLDPEHCLTKVNVFIRREEITARVAEPRKPATEAVTPEETRTPAQPPAPVTPAPTLEKPRRPWYWWFWKPRAERPRSQAAATGERRDVVAMIPGGAAASQDAPPSAQAAGDAPPAPPEPPPPPPFAVAAGQWPYDSALFGRLLDELVRKKGALDPAVVGAADTGLGSWLGHPLPPEAFANFEAAEPGEPDGVDQDGDQIHDDIVGAGVSRTRGESRDIGDVALCDGDQTALLASNDELISHGVVVASRASGYGLRQAHPNLAVHLPQVMFYRLVGQHCSPDDITDVGDAQMAASLRFLLPKATVYSLSWMGSSTRPGDFGSAVRSLNAYERKLIFIAAGNTPRDLDGPNPDCPACLGAPNSLDTRDRVVVVGAATPNLARDSRSGFGRKTVRIYAPADAIGALSYGGKPADGFAPATSYGTPYAAFGGALLSSIGPKFKYVSSAQALGRLSLATWPLAGQPDQPEARVVDLLKLINVLHDSIQVIETAANGQRVFRTHVGDIVDGLQHICQSGDISNKAFQGLRLGPADGSQYREITAYRRTLDENTREPETRSFKCRPEGSLTVQDLDGRPLVLPLGAIDQILFSWGPPGRTPK